MKIYTKPYLELKNKIFDEDIAFDFNLSILTELEGELEEEQVWGNED